MNLMILSRNLKNFKLREETYNKQRYMLSKQYIYYKSLHYKLLKNTTEYLAIMLIYCIYFVFINLVLHKISQT